MGHCVSHQRLTFSRLTNYHNFPMTYTEKLVSAITVSIIISSHLNGIGQPFEFSGKTIPTSWLVFRSYEILGVIAVASSDIHTLFTAFKLSKYSDSSLHLSCPSTTCVLSAVMHLTKSYDGKCQVCLFPTSIMK